MRYDFGVKQGSRSSLFLQTRCMRALASPTLELSTLGHQPTPSLLSSPHRLLICHCVNACFLCASVLSGDHCLRAPGPESGRSSPYHSQLDVRSSTPTSYQAPKHFHIPGRRCQPGILAWVHALWGCQAPELPTRCCIGTEEELVPGGPSLTSHPH